MTMTTDPKPTLTRHASARRAGFTLLELIVTITIMAIIAGSAVPLASMAINSKKKRATIEELDSLQVAAAEYFRDTGSLPTAIADMETNPGVANWYGPYLERHSIDQLSGLSQYAVDAWSQPYSLSTSGSVLTISSAALGGVHGDANDLSCALDVTPIRREKTLEILGIVNGAITRYNAKWLGTDPLPASYSSLLSKLVFSGYLPATAPYGVDGWGDAFVADPAGLTPVVKVGSTNM